MVETLDIIKSLVCVSLGKKNQSMHPGVLCTGVFKNITHPLLSPSLSHLHTMLLLSL